MTKLQVQRDIDSAFLKLRRGETIEYRPWAYEFQGEDEQKRIAKGLYVFCFGHGEFDVLKSPEDVVAEE